VYTSGTAVQAKTSGAAQYARLRRQHAACLFKFLLQPTPVAAQSQEVYLRLTQ